MSLPIRSNLLLAVVCLLAPANAYDIDLTSCNTDAKSTYISNAVADSQSMLQAGKEALLESQEGDTRKAVWKTDDESQLQQIQGYFSTVLDTEGLFQYSAGSSPLIYCDDSSWIKLGNAGTASQWWDSTQELIINTSKAKLCDNSAGPQAGLATTYRVSNNKLDDNDKGLSSIVIMCNAGPDVTGASPDTSGNVATLQEIVSQTTDPTDPDKYPGNGKKSFYVGKSLDYIVGYWLSSFTVAHEFTHVVQATKITSGSAEVYGWKGVSGTRANGAQITTFDAAIVNGDSYAYWALSAYIEKLTDYSVVSGALFKQS